MELVKLVEKARMIREIETEIIVTDRQLIAEYEKIRNLPGQEVRIKEIEMMKQDLKTVQDNLIEWTINE